MSRVYPIPVVIDPHQFVRSSFPKKTREQLCTSVSREHVTGTGPDANEVVPAVERRPAARRLNARDVRLFSRLANRRITRRRGEWAKNRRGLRCDFAG